MVKKRVFIDPGCIEIIESGGKHFLKRVESSSDSNNYCLDSNFSIDRESINLDSGKDPDMAMGKCVDT